MATVQLTIPDALLARLLTALKASYPTLTDGKTNAAEVNAVLKFWLTETLANYEAGLAAADTTTNVQSLIDGATAKVTAARTKAQTDASTIT